MLPRGDLGERLDLTEGKDSGLGTGFIFMAFYHMEKLVMNVQS